MLANIERARAELKKRAASPMVKAAQLDQALALVDGALVEASQALRINALAIMQLDRGSDGGLLDDLLRAKVAAIAHPDDAFNLDDVEVQP